VFEGTERNTKDTSECLWTVCRGPGAPRGPKLERVSGRSCVGLSVCRWSGGPSWWELMSVLLGVTASRFTLPLILPHTCRATHTNTHTFFPDSLFFQGISFWHKDTLAHAGLKPWSRCPSGGVICVTPPLTPPVTHLHSSSTPRSQRAAAGTLRGAFEGDEAVVDGILWPLGHRHNTHTHTHTQGAYSAGSHGGDRRYEWYPSGFRHRWIHHKSKCLASFDRKIIYNNFDMRSKHRNGLWI